CRLAVCRINLEGRSNKNCTGGIMPKYIWEAKSRTGSVQKGVMEASSAAIVEAQLKKYGLSGISVKEEGRKFSLNLPGGGGKVQTKDLVVFTRQFATMIDS